MIKAHQGFTLNEILVTSAILLIIGLIVLIGINPMAQIFRGYDTRRKSDISEIKNALENYYADHECYPLFPLKDVNNNPSYTCDSDFLEPYLPAMPCDPNTKEPYPVYLVPEDVSCPQQFAIYAQIHSFFDKDANSIPYCPKTVAASSPNISTPYLTKGCSGRDFCQKRYSCVDGACIFVAEGIDPNPCSKSSWCEDDCNDVDCANPNNFCN